MRALAAASIAACILGCGTRTTPWDLDPPDASSLHDDATPRVDSAISRPDTTPIVDSFAAPDTRMDDARFDVVPDAPVAIVSAKSMSLGDDHSCALMADSTVRCWGLNANGQLGDGTTTTRSKPEPVVGVAGALEIVAGGRHNCVRKTGGTVQCWGWNDRGQLGDGTFDDRTLAVTVPGVSGVVQIAGGHWHTCVTLDDGTVRCWGEDAKGQLGDGDTRAKSSPVVVAGLGGIQRVAAGCEHTCALTFGGRVYCWGDNSEGQIVPGGPKTVPTPTLLETSEPIADISLGCWKTATRAVTGDVKQIVLSSSDTTITLNADGTVSDGVTGYLGAVSRVIEVAAGNWHACARRDDDSIWCAGYNYYGELGYDTKTHYAAAAPVPF